MSYRQTYQNDNTLVGSTTTGGSCPSCGHCPHCGRGNALPFGPWPSYPAYPPAWPYWQPNPTIVCNEWHPPGTFTCSVSN